MNSELEELKKDIRQSLAQGKATFALDRFHTLTIKIIRNYCVVHDGNGDGSDFHKSFNIISYTTFE